MVFVRAVHAAKHMTDTELAVYDTWFDPVISTLPTLVGALCCAVCWAGHGWGLRAEKSGSCGGNVGMGEGPPGSV